MTKRIILEPSEVWDYCVQHAESLAGSSKLIADNIISGAQVYLSLFGDIPTIFACVDSEEVDEEPVRDEEDCKETVKMFYDRYLDDYIDEAIVDSVSEADRYDKEMLIDEREFEISGIMADMVEALVPNIYDVERDTDEMYEELADLICEYLYRNRGISVYRPMYLECDDGSEEFCEHPYEEMEYDED